MDVNIVEGLVVDSGSGVNFLGSRCEVCSETIFPAVADCPLCAKPGTMAPIALPGRGVVLRAIVAERGPSGFPVPYVQSYVALDDGPVVYSTLDVPIDEADVAVGVRVEVFLAPMSRADDRTNFGWKFRRPFSAA